MTADLTPHPSALPTTHLSREAVRQALAGWHSDSNVSALLEESYLFRRARLSVNGSLRHAYNRTLQQSLDRLTETHPELARILQLRYPDNLTTETVANQLNLAQSTFFDHQKAAVDHLTAILNVMEQEARLERYRTLTRKLEALRHAPLIGVDKQLDALVPLVIDPAFAWIIAIEGIGGIGKTTLADELVRRVIGEDITWDDVAWVTARQSEFHLNGKLVAVAKPALTVEMLVEQLCKQLCPNQLQPTSYTGEQFLSLLEEHLRNHKCLIVIDNLETLVDVECLLPALRRLMNPAKFILTSRQSFYAESGVYHVAVRELCEEDALALVRQEAQQSNLQQVVSARDEELRPIYRTVGGNPLALHLVVGQLHVFGLKQVLHDLHEAAGKTAENFYTYIFRRAWDYLDEPARRTLIAMLFTSDYGDTLTDLNVTCVELSLDDLRSGLRQLAMLNLVESRGGLDERRYTIHNLTRSFLHKQVVLWQ